jgi:hypothetical protein
MDFAKGEKSVAIAAVFHESGLQTGFYADDLGEVDIAFELTPRLGFDIEILEPVTFQHHDAGFFRVRGIDEHTLGHLGKNSVGRPWRDFPGRGARPGGPIASKRMAGQGRHQTSRRTSSGSGVQDA